MRASTRYLYLGIAFSLPFFLANLLVAIEEKFFLSLLRPVGQATSYEQPFVLILIALVGIGGLVSLVPILKDRRLYIVNAILGAVFVAFSLFAGYELGKDFYHCQILQIPNCD